MRGHLEQIMNDIATAFGFDVQEFIAYCYEDTVGGWDKDEGRWPVGSIWSVEGRVIYSLVRYLKPDYAVEVGTYHGCSAEHIAAAMRENGKGKLYCVDNGSWGVAPGHMLAEWALEHIEFVNGDGADFLNNDPIAGKVGFVFEDGDHSPDLCERVWRAAAGNIAPGGIIVSHDAMHFLVGNDVRTGIINSGVPNPLFYLIEPSDCGLALAKLPEVEKPKNDEALFAEDEVVDEPPPPKPKRKPGRPRKKTVKQPA